MLSVRIRLNRQAEFDPEIQIPIDPRLDFLPVPVQHIYKTRQLELTYSEADPLTIISIEEETRLGTR